MLLLLLDKQEWEQAIAIVHEMAAAGPPQAAAEAVVSVMAAMQMLGSSSNIAMMAATMPLLHAADQHTSIAEVSWPES